MTMPKVEVRESVVIENQGQKIFGIFHRPLSPDPCPAILLCHGLAGNKSGKSRLYVALSQKLAEQGIASLRIDFRGSGDSEGEFSEMTLESEVSDALLALEFLKTIPDIYTQRIGLFGRSVGGMVALKAARCYGEIKSLAIWASPFDTHQWQQQWQLAHAPQISQEQRLNMMRFNGQLPSYTFFKQLFDSRMDDELTALTQIPLLHIHGEKDNVVAIEHANRYMRSREQATGISEFIRLPNTDHDFSHPQEQQLAINKTCRWFADTLQGCTAAAHSYKTSHGAVV